MSQSSSLKRKRPDLALGSQSSLTGNENPVYDLIHSKGNMGIWIGDIRHELKLPDSIVKKIIKLLLTKNLIKEVVNIRNKGRKHYMATEFTPSVELTGGVWYTTDGKFDIDFINAIKDVCLKYISRHKVATLDGIMEWARRDSIFHVAVSAEQLGEILQTLVLGDEIIEVESTGSGDFASVPRGTICYKSKSKGSVRGEKKPSAMASIPCGVCPRINYCTPDGKISPSTCAYYEKWLDF